MLGLDLQDGACSKSSEGCFLAMFQQQNVCMGSMALCVMNVSPTCMRGIVIPEVWEFCMRLQITFGTCYARLYCGKQQAYQQRASPSPATMYLADLNPSFGVPLILS